MTIFRNSAKEMETVIRLELPGVLETVYQLEYINPKEKTTIRKGFRTPPLNPHKKTKSRKKTNGR